jgi:hypothetical protein
LTFHNYGARVFYLGIVALATVSGAQLDFGRSGSGSSLGGALDLTFMPRDAVDGLRNLALFAGWGLIWIVTGPGDRLRRRVVLATLTGAGISVCVEAIQFFSTNRISSVLDVATNTAGAFGGAVAAVAAARVIHASQSARSFVGVPIVIFAVSYCGAVALDAVLPLHRHRQGQHDDRLRRGREGRDQEARGRASPPDRGHHFRLRSREAPGALG